MALLAVGCIAVAMQSSAKPVEAMEVEVGDSSSTRLVTLHAPRHAENALQAQPFSRHGYELLDLCAWNQSKASLMSVCMYPR